MYASLVTNYGLVVLLNNCSVFPVALFSRYEEEAEKSRRKVNGVNTDLCHLLEPSLTVRPFEERSQHSFCTKIEIFWSIKIKVMKARLYL